MHRPASQVASLSLPVLFEALLLLGMPLSLATQVRPFNLGGQSFGPGEVLLLAWTAGAWLLRPDRLSTIRQMFKRKLGIYWGIAFAGLLIGWMNATLNSLVPPDGTQLHDWTAYLLCAVLSMGFLSVGPATNKEQLDFSLKLGLALAMPLCILWVAALGAIEARPLNFWYAYRFVGWAVNPNQTALALILVPFLLFHALDGYVRAGRCPSLYLLTIVVGATLSIGVIWSTSSNAGRLALVLALTMLLLVTLHRWRFGEDDAAGRVAKVFLLVIGLAVAMDFRVGPETRMVHPEAKVEAQSVRGEILEPFVNKDDAPREISARWALVKHGLMAAADSNLIGFGPGCFSGLDGPFTGSEAHNTPIDWLTSAGFLGLVALTVLLVDLARGLWRRRAYSLLAGLATLAAFGQFHYVLRHPLVWIFLAFAETVARCDERSPSVDEV